MAKKWRVTQAGLVAVAKTDPSVRVTQAGLVVLAQIAEGAPVRVTQAGLVVLAQHSPPLRVTQAGLVAVGKRPVPYIRAVGEMAGTAPRIMLTIRRGADLTEHRLYRSLTPFVTAPGPTTVTFDIFAPGALDSMEFWDYGDPAVAWGTTYYYALSAIVDGIYFTAYAEATTPGLAAVTLYVGGIGPTSAILAVDPISEWLEVEFLTLDGVGDTVDAYSSTSAFYRYWRFLEGLTPSTEYTSRARVRLAAGWSEWSDDVVWATLDVADPGDFTCPPQFSGIAHNPDGNSWDRYGRGFFRPLPGQPMRGTAAEIIFRWHVEAHWDIYLSDDAGATWALIRAGLGRTGDADRDHLVRHQMTWDTTAYPNGMDYRLRAVSTDLDPVVTWESMTFPIDNDGEVRWWKAHEGTPDADRWGRAWAETGANIYMTPNGERIWYGNNASGLVALRGHDWALLADREAGESYGADVTVRYFIWSGEGGLFGLQGRDDTEGFWAGVGFFAQGLSTGERRGLWVGMSNLASWVPGCCNDYLTSPTGVEVGVMGQETAGLSFASLGQADPKPVEKGFWKATKKPLQVRDEEVSFVGGIPGFALPGAPTGGAFRVWPLMTWRDGPEPETAGYTVTPNTCARRWEMYSQRTRAELDPLDHKRVRIRVRMDGPGVVDPAAGYWHYDEWHEFAQEWDRGLTGVVSRQIAVDTYGQPNGARIFYSWSCLPFDEVPTDIPPEELPPWVPVVEGAPCTVILQVYAEDRETLLWEVGDDPYHPRSFLCVPENYGEQELDIIHGAATIGQVEVVVIDKAQTVGDQDSGWLTEWLSIGGVGAIHGRRCRLLRFISNELGWVVIADGPASSPRMDDSYSAFRWVIRDTRETERKIEAFVEATTSWLLPMGVPGGWGQHVNADGDDDWLVPPQDPLVGTYRVLGTTFERGWVDLRSYWPGGWTFHPSPNQRPVGTQVVPEDVMLLGEIEERFISLGEPLGDPRPIYYEWPDVELLWRPEGSTDEWTVIQPTDTIAATESYAKPRGVDMWWPSRQLARIWDAELADGTEVRAATWLMLRGLEAEGTFPEPDAVIEIAVRYKGKPCTFAPLHLEGLTTGEILKNLYDGVYSAPDPTTGEPVSTGIRYYEADLLEMQDPVLLRLTESVEDARAWAEEYIYAPTGWVPAMDNDGRISPRSQVPPATFDDLTSIDNAITEPVPNWNAGETIVNVLRFTYPRYYRLDPADADSIDRLTSREVEHEYRDPQSIVDHDIQLAEYNGSAFAAVGDETGQPVLTAQDEIGWGHAQARKLYIFDRYKNGAQLIEVPVMRSATATLRAGDWVVADLSWFPDYLTRRRGLVTGGQILAVRDLDCAWRVLLIEEAFPLAEGS
jgi:hypothetical protein